jgi:hypothetical protein
MGTPLVWLKVQKLFRPVDASQLTSNASQGEHPK